MSDTWDEDAWTRDLARAFPAGDLVELGIGDDAAWLRAVPEGWLVATDVLVDGVHGIVAEVGAAALASKAVAVNVSDFAAMGARPRVLVAGLVLPRQDTRAHLEGVRDGLLAATQAHGLSLVGGDTNVADGPLTIAVTMLGTPGRGGVLTRAGARVGDRLSVTGPLGGSLAGRHLAPASRVEAGEILALSGRVHAMMDISDGLARDLPRLARASGVGARIDGERIPIHDDVPPGVADRVQRALCDGEDFELLLAHAPLDVATREALARLGAAPVEIGVVMPPEAGLVLVRGGRAQAWPRGGFDHLAPLR